MSLPLHENYNLSRLPMRILLIYIALIISTLPLAAQRLLWDAELSTQFDNREYNTALTPSQTFFGLRATPELGIGWHAHALKLGVAANLEYGATPFELPPALLLYYQYRSERFGASVGFIPTSQLRGDYPHAIRSDSARFYDNTLQGALLQYVAPRGFIELSIDWRGRRDTYRREQFVILSAGRYARNALYAGYHLQMMHYARQNDGTTATGTNSVVDNIQLHPHLGANISHRIWFDSLTVQAGWVISYQNDRGVENGASLPSGALLDLRLEKYGIGIYNSLYLGDNLLPYYATYGTALYTNDPYYQTNTGVYNRLELYWHAVRSRSLDLKISSIHHYDGVCWGWQQFATLSVTLDQETLGLRRR